MNEKNVEKPIQEWIDTCYKAISLVTHDGVVYLSRKDVPKHISLNNSEYWVRFGNLNKGEIQIINDLLSTRTDAALSANMGRELREMIQNDTYFADILGNATDNLSLASALDENKQYVDTAINNSHVLTGEYIDTTGGTFTLNVTTKDTVS